MNRTAHRTKTCASPLVDLLARRARVHPDRTAVVTDGGELTTSQLWSRSVDLGRRLREVGTVPDDCVGIYADPSLELEVGVWGILAAGAAYLPLSPEYPRDRLQYMITNAGVSTVVVQAAIVDRLRDAIPRGVRVIVVDAQIPPVEPVPDLSAYTRPAPDTLAYVIYTSGSTGRPKGVMIEHRAIGSQMQWLHEHADLREGDRILQKTPFSFDAAQWEILSPAVGATVVMAAPGAYRDPDRIVDTVVRHEVDLLQCVPTLWTALVESGRLPECTSLRHLYSGGEVLTTPLAVALRRQLPGAALTNLYGPTETTINATSLRVDESVLESAGPTVPIGPAVTDTQLIVLDAEGRHVAEGEVGELHIGGIQLARGYINNEELTAQKFVSWEPPDGGPAHRLYRTGDLATWTEWDGIRFLGRADNQVKINGHRIELDEVKVAVEAHHWVRQSCVVPWTSPRTGATLLAAFVELDAGEAALMDQGAHGGHHESKRSRLQVRAQLAQNGLPTGDELAGRLSVALPHAAAGATRTAAAFARKTYRFYDGGPTTGAELTTWLRAALAAPGTPRAARELDLTTLGEVLRWFGPFHSAERLLPKYAYASPGALNATQVHVELTGIAGLRPGLYYFHPLQHRLVLGAPRPDTTTPRVRLHFVGKRSAIEAVYSTNVREVLAMEAGHMLGVLDTVLPDLGLGLRPLPGALIDVAELGHPGDLVAVAGVELVPAAECDPGPAPRLFLQCHATAVDGLSEGLYEVGPHGLLRVGDEIVGRRDVIAINQQVYDRSSFGVTIACPRSAGWAGFVTLGRALQRLQANDVGFGLMSSGYSSLTGRDLPSARRFEELLGADADGPAFLTYFAVGGRISAEQRRSRGMGEDVVHMRGPAEILRDDLREFLPQYMLPARVDVVDALPKTANGKCDVGALTALAAARDAERSVIAPRTPAERRVARIWGDLLGTGDVSMTDDFFASGGNSLIGVALINKINRAFGVELPMQSLFVSGTPELLAAAATQDSDGRRSRLIALQPEGVGRPVYCWPGLGGFPMNLRELGSALGTERPFYGVQAHGINAEETPFSTIEEMAAADVALIRARQPEGPYTLIGYSFGARVAFETAHQLEQDGHEVDRLVLLAPGSPRTGHETGPETGDGAQADFARPAFLQILLSVFTGELASPLLAECLRTVHDEAGFCEFVHTRVGHLAPDLVARIVAVVRRTFSSNYRFDELDRRVVAAPISIFKAAGDDYSFIEARDGYGHLPVRTTDLPHGHYAILHGRPAALLADQIQRHLAPEDGAANPKETTVPHVHIKHFPVPLSPTEREQLFAELTSTITRTFGVAPGAVSIALEPIAEDDWAERVVQPDFVARKDLLCQTPDYYAA